VEESKESGARPQETEHMAPAKSISPITRPLDVERLAKITAGVVLLLYVTGVVGVNSYLFQLGASDFTLIRTRFIYTGTLIWLTLVFVNVPILMGLFSFRRYPGSNDPPSSLVSRIIMRTIALGAALGFAYGMYLIVLNSSKQQPHSGLRLPLILTGMAIVVGLVTLVYAYVRIFPPTAPALVQLVQMFLAGIAIFAIVLAYVWLFMVRAYPLIPEQYGGGRPRQIRLLVAKEYKELLQELDIAFSGKGQLSDQVTLLYEGEDQ
jgi:hypothetical protein